MLISIVNHTSGKIPDEVVQDGIRAVNRQIAHDFTPHWHIGADLRLEGAVGADPDSDHVPELRGDAIIYLWDESDVPGAIGYHAATAGMSIPFGFVFTSLSQELGEPWTVTLSHEALELVADPEVNLLVAGPHPADPTQEVFHWYEMCDAVQAETYKVDGIDVSNFLLPLYFTPFAETGGRNDFLGRLHEGQALPSFGINPGGYVGFYNPQTKQHETFALKGDARARARQRIKAKGQIARRSARYQYGASYPAQVEKAAGAQVGRRAVVRGRSVARGAAMGGKRDVEKIATAPARSGPGVD